MTDTTERAVAALELLPEELREPAVAYLLEQAEKFRALKELIQEGMDDVAQGRATEWNFDEFLREARNEGYCFGQGQAGSPANLPIHRAAQSECRYCCYSTN